mmetsp:Transcript_38193/g.97032  ORF Transcript_38193/g.97032 Transcript_38193/m.97032 type:complete len:227 (+) Transcript_38193:134-814(+)
MGLRAVRVVVGRAVFAAAVGVDLGCYRRRRRRRPAEAAHTCRSRPRRSSTPRCCSRPGSAGRPAPRAGRSAGRSAPARSEGRLPPAWRRPTPRCHPRRRRPARGPPLQRRAAGGRRSGSDCGRHRRPRARCCSPRCGSHSAPAPLAAPPNPRGTRTERGRGSARRAPRRRAAPARRGGAAAAAACAARAAPSTRRARRRRWGVLVMVPWARARRRACGRGGAARRP